MMSDSEEMRSNSNSPPLDDDMHGLDQPDCTDSSSESRTTPEPSDDETAQRKLLELSLAKCFADSAFGQLNGQNVPVYPHKHREERKRRRVIGNSDNTLDGLVAKRADLDPAAKRYQTENEAIELPDDEIEMKRLETDPDVSTRMCSICGYQGKWVSEMIRHKRVHTNERPFKCKYCNRTSKWKADLIRHVAKTHGIRVVSKYSRSKAFDVNTELKEEISSKEEYGRRKMPPLSTFIKEEPSSASSSTSSQSAAACPAFKCLMCLFEETSIDQVISHLHAAHNVSPFECIQCKRTFEEVAAASSHCSGLAPSSCTPLSIKINFSPVYAGQKSSSSRSSAGGHSSSSATTSSPCSIRSDTDGASSALSSRTDDEEAAGAGNLTCNDCPFRTGSEEKLLLHKTGHETPKGLLTYKCVFCSWYSKKRTAIERHMLVHTSRPEDFMAQVERNLITPAMLLETTSKMNRLQMPPPMSAPIFGSFPGLSLFQSPQSAAAAAAAAVATTPSALDLAALTSNFLSAASMYSPLSTPATPNGLPDFAALLGQSSNPLLAFGLCSLLDMQKNANLLKFDTHVV